jgi:response regulator RpfG family c-di-GMP phosphodiesterase
MDDLPEIESGFRWNRDPVVLLVDDDPGTLNAIRRTLRDEPYELITAGSCEEALGWLDDLAVDLVITDQMMPRMTGTELLEVVKKRYPRTARALLTAHPMLSTTQEGPQRGTDKFLFKPWNDRLLVEAVRRLLEKGGAEPAGT